MAYSHLRWFVDVVVRLFFRQVDKVGTYRIPKSGPTIFVANHANQFVDPMMLITNIPRVVRFLIAGKSLKRPIIGDAARAAQAIGVDRPQDLAKKGSGSISGNSGDATITGDGTNFLKDLVAGSKLKVGDDEHTVKSVESDTSCNVMSPSSSSFTKSSYKILPKVDQNAVYTKVHEALKSGDCIGIFPEGGSHDQAHMLDLKPGVAIMALGAMNAGAGAVQICPCGLNYFEPYRFRSRVVVEFGEPISVPSELAEQYKTDKRAAVASLMQLIEQGMKSVMPGATDYREMQAILTMRALYKPHNRQFTAEENLTITKRFALGIQTMKGKDQRISDLIEEVITYNNKLQAANVRDRDVRENLVSSSVLQSTKIRSLLEVILLAPFAMVLCLMFLPVATVTYLSAVKEKQTALAGSSVKVKALDVVASQKIKVGLVVVPIYGALLALLATWYSGLQWWFFFVLYGVAWPLLTVVGLRMCDRFGRQLLHCRTNFMSRGRTEALQTIRSELQQKTRQLVEELGPQVIEDFNTKRIIKAEDLEKDNLLQPLLASYSDLG